MKTEIYLNYIGGKWKRCSSHKVFQSLNPADLTEAVGEVQASGKEDVRNAISAAETAFKTWRKTTVYQRADFLKKVLAGLTVKRQQIAELVTLENGKVLPESLGEVDSAIWEMEFQINEGLRAYGETIPSARSGIFAYTRREPLGVAAIITPWNFPVNVAFRKLTPALMAGNTVIFKPASFTPVVGAKIAELFAEAGMPEGVFNFVTGAGGEIGETITGEPTIKTISFTGSTEVGLEIERNAAKNHCRVQLEMGGKNPVVVLADADVEAAAEAAVKAAFACAGQWCTSTSRAIVEKKIAKTFTDKVLEKTAMIKVGPGMEKSSTMGPVAGQSQMKRILDYIEKGKNEGAKLLTGGRQIKKGNFEKGCFIEPTIFGDVKEDMVIAKEEIFGPVLSIICVENFEQAMEAANNIQFGLSSSIFTKDFSKAMRFVEETEAGLTHVNMFTAYKEPSLPFGGVKNSGSMIPEAGKTGIEFFSNHKTVYMNYGGR